MDLVFVRAYVNNTIGLPAQDGMGEQERFVYYPYYNIPFTPGQPAFHLRQAVAVRLQKPVHRITIYAKKTMQTRIDDASTTFPSICLPVPDGNGPSITIYVKTHRAYYAPPPDHITFKLRMHGDELTMMMPKTALLGEVVAQAIDDNSVPKNASINDYSVREHGDKMLIDVGIEAGGKYWLHFRF